MPAKRSSVPAAAPSPELVPAWGDWTVVRGPGFRVALCYQGQPVTDSKGGDHAYEKACEMAAHFHARGHKPDLTPRRCLADLTPAKREEACLLQGYGHPTAGVRPFPLKS